jgi:hypothetical protein
MAVLKYNFKKDLNKNLKYTGCQISRRLSLIILGLILAFLSGHGADAQTGFTRSEKALIRKANTARFAFYHGRRMKEFIRLMNLARTDPALLDKYVDNKYDMDISRVVALAADRVLHPAVLLRPSLGLHLGSWWHAIESGLKGTVGHQGFDKRRLATLNLNTLLPGVASGENCEYGNNEALNIFIALMNSTGHRANILDPSYMRVGVSKKWHKIYTRNTVTMFSGPKLQDRLFYRKAMKRTMNIQPAGQELRIAGLQ